VKFGFGGYVVSFFWVIDQLTSSAGAFKCPLFDVDGTTCKGIETVDGTQYFADKVVLAAGAWSPTLVDLEDQCVSKVC
jgi:sarcosine oxidase/L-pipecolate oxidase